MKFTFVQINMSRIVIVQLKLAVNANQVNPELSVYPFEYRGLQDFSIKHIIMSLNVQTAGVYQVIHTCKLLYLGAACKELISSLIQAIVSD